MKKTFLIYFKEGFFVLFFVIFIGSTIMQLTTPTGAVSIDDSIEYQELANGDYTISGFSGDKKTIEIPETYQNGTVVGIEGEVFKDTDIHEINLPRSVEFFGYHALNTKELLKIIVDENTSEFYTTILDESILNDSEALMIEHEYVQATVNGEQITGSSYVYEGIENNLIVTLSIVKQASYSYEKGVWDFDTSSFQYLLSDTAEISWLYNGELYTNDSTLYVEDVSIMDGVFSAIYADEELFRLDLSKEHRVEEAAVETGRQGYNIPVLLTIVSLCMLLIIKLFKVKSILNGK